MTDPMRAVAVVRPGGPDVLQIETRPIPVPEAGEILIRVEDFPTDEVLDSLGIESPFDLLGLYSGVDLARKSGTDVSALPDMVFLYRRPILDYWVEHEETLGAIVTHVLVHEIGHHFGLSDADMERIEHDASA